MDDRPAIVSIQESDDGEHTRVVISLMWHDVTYSGEAIGDSHWTYRPRLVGEATLRAVERVTDSKVKLRLAAIATAPLGDAQVAMAQVMVDGEPEPFVGSALIGSNDEAAAAVKAVLDALNRRISAVL